MYTLVDFLYPARRLGNEVARDAGSIDLLRLFIHSGNLTKIFQVPSYWMVSVISTSNLFRNSETTGFA